MLSNMLNFSWNSTLVILIPIMLIKNNAFQNLIDYSLIAIRYFILISLQYEYNLF